MSLSNLNELAIKAKEDFNKYHKEEILLTNEFKSGFSALLKSNSNDLIRYSTYTSIIESTTGLTITFPNQWFYIASYFVHFASELRNYKNGYSSIFQGVTDSKEIIKQIKESKVIPPDIISKINNHYTNKLDSENFQKFLSDYDWWFGSKTIDRSDYYVSPILNLAKVVNVSQSYIADLAYLLSESGNLLSALKNSIVKADINQEVINELINEDTSIRNFAFFVFKYFYGTNWKVLIDKCEKKPSQINSKVFQSYDLDVFKRLLASFEDLQNKDSLTSANTQRYFEDPILILDSKYYYFTTQWNGGDEYELSFLNLKNYFESNFPNYIILKDDRTYRLLKRDNNSKIFNDFKISLNDAGLIFSDQLVQRFIASLLTKPFVICSGLSGSGKTKLAQAFVQWICESDNQYKIIPVGADWTNREPLLGYPNGLDPKAYVTPDSGALQLILEASKEENQNKPYFMILDEMNLSHVERYFADFLSIMESKEKLKLYSGEKRYSQYTKENEFDEEYFIPYEIEWPKNLFIIGTVNIDETTYMFSPKVLDRANVIEFRITPKEMDKFFKERKELNMKELFLDKDKNKGGAGQNMAENFFQLAEVKTITKIPEIEGDDNVLNEFFNELQIVGSEFGYRSASEIELLITKLGKVFIDDQGQSLNNNTKIDIAIMQKLLPKLHGSRKKLVGPLETLAGFCLVRINESQPDDQNKKKTLYQQFISEKRDSAKWEIKYSISFEKIERMLKNVIENGFTSYAEA